MDSKDTDIDERGDGSEEIDDPQWQSNEGRVVQSGGNSGSL